MATTATTTFYTYTYSFHNYDIELICYNDCKTKKNMAFISVSHIIHENPFYKGYIQICDNELKVTDSILHNISIYWDGTLKKY